MMNSLKYYKNLDAFLLHWFIAKMSEFYEQHNTDVLKETLTNSGAANKVFRDSNKSEGLFLVSK